MVIGTTSALLNEYRNRVYRCGQGMAGAVDTSSPFHMMVEKAGGPMPRLDNSIDIKLPKDRVFEYVSDITHRAEWVKWTKRAEVTSREPGVVGSTDAGLMQVGPQK